MSTYFLFDIGGTNMRLGVSRDGEEVEEAQIFSTPKNFEDGIKLISDKVTELLSGTKIDVVAGGIAGPLNKEKSALVNAPNLTEWIGKPLKEEISKMSGTEVYIENDAAMLGLGEAVYGAGAEHKIVAFVVIGTGVGGARIVDKQIDTNAYGFEIGHQIIDVASGRELESFISGREIENKFGKKPFDIEEPAVWEDVARYLAIGLNNVIVHWSPEVIVLGGSLAKKIPIDRVEAHLKERMKIFPEIPPIKKASYGDLAGLYGALHYLKIIGLATK